ncbi:glycosyl transferase, group 1 family protein [Sulfuriferula multivorans]|uniref:Glycosyl transferase, group 1 family protein n=1 Tax=Sulfuriferula multivorans TaxID=1559896 RepID=A0A401JDK9_9PROT|nr:glycosyltransferase family 4 protein [Sulfuriferula multivorans]GBL45752.1 glycosyl transferase, group 1 family protein [Sulfuriferula multivorans]
MKSCLFINNSPQPGRKHLAKLGGGGKSLLSLLAQIPEQGWQAHVVVPGEGQFTDALVDMGIPHTIFPFRLLDWRRPMEAARTTLAWRRIMQKVNPTLIHANGFDLSRSFALAAGSLNIPFITHVRFPIEPEGARWVLRGLPKPAAFIFNSQAMQDRLWPDVIKNAPHSRPYTVHNAVDLASFTPAPWPEGSPYRIGIVANFAPFKRHEDFLRMAAEMLKTRQDLEFLIVGDDTEGAGRRAVLETLAEELGIAPYVRFLGHRADIPDIMRQLHVLVVPSQFEPFGRVVIEAMACGRPVVASRDGGIPEIIDDGKTGSLVEVGDYAGFARAALDLIDNRERWENFSRNSVEAAQRRFSIQAHTKNILDIYGELSAR